MPFAAIYVPDFPVEAIVRAEPELRPQAVAVLEGTPPLARVIAANDKAGQAGVETAMTQLEAQSCLATACPPGTWSLRRRSPAQEAAAHAAVMDCACAFSPRVEETAADTVLLDLAGLERIFGPPAKIARELARRCSQAGVEANVAVASNPDAALHAARGFAGVTVIAPGQEAERLASLPIDVLLWPLNPVTPDSPPEPARPANEILETLDRWGVRNLRALAALPEVAITERLGQQGLRLQRLARGAGSRPLAVAEPPLRFEEALELEHPVELLEPLSFLLSRMLEQLCARLAARALAAHELRLSLGLDFAEDREIGSSGHRVLEKNLQFVIGNLPGGHEIQPPENYKSQITNFQSLAPGGSPAVHQRTLRLPVPMLDPKVFLRLLQLDLKAHPPPAPVVKIRLAAQPAEPRRAQNGLFLPSAPAPEKLEVLLARLAAVVEKPDSKSGNGEPTTGNSEPETGNWKLETGNAPEPRVGSPELLDTHRPGAFRMRRFAPPEPSPVAGRQPPESGPGSMASGQSRPAVTALRVFRPPLPVVVEVREGRPAHLGCASKPALRGDVIWAAGPWRASGGWWEDGISDFRSKKEDCKAVVSAPPNLQSASGWEREEWDVAVRNEAGVTLYRLVRDLAEKTWLLEGSYD